MDIHNFPFQTLNTDPNVIHLLAYTVAKPNANELAFSFTIDSFLGMRESAMRDGYAFLAKITIEGVTEQVRIKAATGDDWVGIEPRTRTLTLTCPAFTGEKPVTFQVVSDGPISTEAGVINNSGFTVNNSLNDIVFAYLGKPWYVVASPEVTENSSTLTWKGTRLGPGRHNRIAGYSISYRDNVGGVWGDLQSLTKVNSSETSGSLRVLAPTQPGVLRCFYVEAIAPLYSGTIDSGMRQSNSIQRNTPATGPTDVTADPAVYGLEEITVTWSGAVAGSSPIKGYRIARHTSADGTTWSEWDIVQEITLAATGGSIIDTGLTRTPGIATQYGVWTIDTLGMYSPETVSNAVMCVTTACMPPTSAAVNETVAETTVILSWAGAGPGAGNAITAYEIQYSDSPDNATWGDWTALAAVNTTAPSGTLSVEPPPVGGHYRRFRIRTWGSAGEDYKSDWKVTANSVRRNVSAEPPTTFEATPEIYATPRITLTWSGAVAGISGIKQYVIQHSTSADGITWSGWTNTAVIPSAATGGTHVVEASGIGGMQTRYRIAAMDNRDGMSAYTVSNTVRKNRLPITPTVHAPTDGSITYNKTPLMLLQTYDEPEGYLQELSVAVNSVWFTGDANPEHFSRDATSTAGIQVVFICPKLTEERVDVRVECHDQFSGSGVVSRSFAIAPFSLEEIEANKTRVKAEHITTLRTAINHVRHYYGLLPYRWALEMVRGRTQIRDWPMHILELRAAIDSLMEMLRLFDPESVLIPQYEWLPLGAGRPRADVVRQIADIIMKL